MDLNALKQALAPLREVGKEEMVFDIEGTRVVLRPLLPLEEVAVQRYAASVLDQVQKQEGLSEDDQMSRAAALDYFDRFRIEIISHAVVQVNDTDLREVRTIPTGEFLNNGVAIQMPKNLAMRSIVSEWSRAMITICFAKYGELIQKISDKAEKLTEKSVSDIDAEIERVRGKLERLNSDKKNRAAGDPNITRNQINSLLEAGEAIKRQTEEASREVREQAEEEEIDRLKNRVSQEAQRDQPLRTPVYPKQAPPPTAGYSGAGSMGSFFDPTEEAQEGESEPPRLQTQEKIARARAAALSDVEDKDPLSMATPVGKIGGIDAYRLPSEEVSARGKKSNETEKKEPDPNTGTRNPNFRPQR
jgi:hypothetical protein